MEVRNGFKRCRRSLMRMNKKFYIRLITAFVVLGIFISEGAVKDISEAQSFKEATTLTKPERTSVSRSSSVSASKNKAWNESRNASASADPPASVSRTLQELLQQEATPERIFGFSTSDKNSTHDQTLNSAPSSKERTFENAEPRNDSRKVAPKIIRRQLEGTDTLPAKVVNASQHTDSFLDETNITQRNDSNIPTGHNPFRGVLLTEETRLLFDRDNVTHLSFILYRLIKTHNINSVLDVPCTNSMLWMRDLLQVLEFEVPRFHYKCLAPDDKRLAEGVVRYQHLSSAIVLKNPYPWAATLPRADLALCWYGMGFLPPHQSWGLLKALRNAGVKFVILPNFPEVRHNPGSGSASGRINVRRAPYRFNEPLRVVNNVSSKASTPKQLLLYDLTNIRKDAL